MKKNILSINHLNSIYLNQKHAEAYFKYIQTNIINLKEQKLVKSLFPELSSKKCLEIGCAGAIYSKAMLNCNARKVDSLDSSAAMIKIAKESTKSEVNYHHQDINLEFHLKDKYDFICASYVLHYSNNLRKTLTNILTLLNPKGILIFTVPNPQKFNQEEKQLYLGEDQLATTFYNHSKENYFTILTPLGTVMKSESNQDIFIVKFQKK